MGIHRVVVFVEVIVYCIQSLEWNCDSICVVMCNDLKFCDYLCFALHAAGPAVESTMTLTFLYTRDVGPNVNFRLSFNVSLGLPSRINCTRDGATIHIGRGFVSGVNYEVVRPLYVSTSQPEITRVSFEELTRPRMGATYSCTVYVEGRRNIASVANYNFDHLGSATSTVTVTGE